MDVDDSAGETTVTKDGHQPTVEAPAPAAAPSAAAETKVTEAASSREPKGAPDPAVSTEPTRTAPEPKMAAADAAVSTELRVAAADAAASAEPPSAAEPKATEPKVTAAEAAASAEPPAASLGSRQGVPGWQLVAQIVAFVVILAIAIVGILEWRRADRLSSQHNDRLNASQAAGAFAEALLTYDSANPTATLNRLKTMATASYQPKIEQARSGALSGPAQQSKTTSTAHVENTYITEVDGNSADAVCQTSWLVSSAGQTAPAVDFYLKVALKRQGGGWKIDNVAGLAAVQPPGTGTPATTTPSPVTPSTTVPGSPPPTG